MQASQSLLNSQESGKQPTQLNTVICRICGGQNHAANMTHDSATDSYVCDFCQLDDTEPIPFRPTAPPLVAFTDDELCQHFIDYHFQGETDQARPFLAELIRRDTQRHAIESLELSERLVTGKANGGYFQALGQLARLVRGKAVQR